MTKDEYTRKMWLYYLRLEDEFINTMNYVEFSECNMQTYSREYSKILLSIGSEVDIICKQLCQQICHEKSCNNITQYAEILCDYGDLPFARVEFAYSKEEYAPFADWAPDNSPSWWKAYNCIKHNRVADENERVGNLKNVFLAIAGLFVLNRYLCREICAGRVMNEPSVPSKMFKMVGWESCTEMDNGFVRVAHADGRMSVVYDG